MFLAAFIVSSSFYTGFHVAILHPRVKLTKQQSLFYCMCIKANRYRYSYGRQANKTLTTLPIPSMNEIPDWVAVTNLNVLNGVSKALAQESPASLNPRNWKTFRYDYLFDIERGKGPTKASLSGTGKTPFITSIDSNNGLTGFTDEKPEHDGNVITVNRNGSVAEAFYQSEPFSTTEDVHVFKPQFQLNKFVAMFLLPLIRREQYRFSYGRKWGLERMNKSVIRLPVTPAGEPDWKFMERYIMSLPYSKSI